MFGKNAMKYPALVMGIIMFVIFLSQNSTQKWLSGHKRRFIPSTCDSVKDRVNIKAPGSWSMECPTTNFLVLTIEFAEKAKDPKMTRVLMYRELANIYSKFAHYANIPLEYVEDNKRKVYNEVETLERLKDVRIILQNDQYIITSQSDGQAIAKFLDLKRKEQIAEHLRLTVKVSEKKL